MSIIAKGVGAILVHELRSARAMHRRERGRRPGRSLEWLKFKKLTARKSGIQARHLYISARKRSGLRHAGKLAYPAKPLNVESLDRPIWAHKKQGNHPAGVIVDMQFPCHSTRLPPAHAPGAGSMRGIRLLVPMRGTRWFHGWGNLSMQVGYCLLCGEGAVETAAMPIQSGQATEA